MSRPLEHRLTPDEQLCFIHIPKTAGTTLTSLLNSKFHHNEICPAEVWSELVAIPKPDLAKYRLFRGHFFYDMGALLPRPPVYVTMLRHPIDRVVSGYEFMRRCVPSRAEAMPNHLKAQSMSLLEYVNDPENPSMSNSQTRHLSSGLYKDDPAQWLAVAKQHLQDMAFVGLVEQFEPSMALLSYTFGWNPLAEYQNLMVSPRKQKRQLEPDVWDAIARRNALDLELYEFAQELFATRQAEMMAALKDSSLEQHYRQRYAERAPKRTANLAFDFAQAMAGSGWHLREGDAQAFRWTGPGTVATLDLPLAREQDLVVEFCVINALAPDILQSLTLSVNGQAIELGVLYSHDQTTIFQGVIPQAVLSAHPEQPFTRLTFRVDRTLSPQDLNPHDPDHRQVGVALSSIQTFVTREVALAKTAGFMFQSAPWKETADFVQQHLQPGQQILAPTVFRDRFPAHIPPYTSRLPAVRNYNPEWPPNLAWAILHKGMMSEMGTILGKLVLGKLAGRGFVPLFANEVFVVLGRPDSGLPRLPYQAAHVRSLYVGYLKYFWHHPDRLWNQVNQQVKRLIKQNLKPDSLPTLKPPFKSDAP